jgi:hypothetical protein
MMKRILRGCLAAGVLGIAMAAPVQAQAVPIILSDEQAGALCNFQMVGADVYLVVGAWPYQVTYRYTCDGTSWVISGMF